MVFFPNKTKLKFANSESHSIRNIIIVHLLDKNVRAAETIALENQNHLSVLESTTLSRFFNQERNAPITQAQHTLYARCIIYVHSLQKINSIKRCLQYRLLKPSKSSLRRVTAAVEYWAQYNNRADNLSVFNDSKSSNIFCHPL